MKKKKEPQRTKKTEPFINKYNSEGMNYASEKDDWKKFEKNNVTIAFNVLYAKKIYRAYVSKHNSNCEKQVILLMISNGEKQCVASLKNDNNVIILQSKIRNYQHY